MHAEDDLTPPPRPVPPVTDPVLALVRSGVIDREWVGAQSGESPQDDEAAARLAVERDLSPHPLFEIAWLPRRKMMTRSGVHPVVWYFAERRRRNRFAPHPLVSTREINQATPEAREHEFGALSYWLRTATPDTPLPTAALAREITWGEYRSAALRAAREWRAEVAPPRPAVETPQPYVRGSDAHSDEPLVSVVMAVLNDADHIRDAIGSIQAQRLKRWELLVVDRGSNDDTVGVVEGMGHFDARIRVVEAPATSLGEALNVGISRAGAEAIAFLDPARTWLPRHLLLQYGHLSAHGLDTVHADGPTVARTATEVLSGRIVDLSTTMVRRSRLAELGGFDATLGEGCETDLVLRLGAETPLTALAVPVVRRPRPLPRSGDDWSSVVLERHLVDWQTARTSHPQAGLVSLVTPLTTDLRRSVEWLLTVPGPDIELVVVGTQLGRAHQVLVASLCEVLDGARHVSIRCDVNVSVALNLGASRAAGDKVVLVRPVVAAPRGGMQTLAAALTDGAALAQPLVVDKDRLVLTAGAMFRRRMTPALLFAGHPLADPERLGTSTVPAPASPVVAAHRSTLAALGGLDARFRDILAETDLGLRAQREGLGHSVLEPAALVFSQEAYAEPDQWAPAIATLNRAGHPLPADDASDLHFRAGFDITDERNVLLGTGPTAPLDDPVLATVPVLRTRRRIHESPPRLRWAIDIASPAAPRGDRWGDTHFAGSLAQALMRQGQDVAVDRRDARHRATRDHDDVVLVLRGLDRVAMRPGPLAMQWIISHPDMVTPEEVARFDLVYAASLQWSRQVTESWGTPVHPLLQCTDPTLFNPDRAAPDSGPSTLFVGNSRGVHRLAVRAALAAGADLTLHGRDWAEFLPKEAVTSEAVDNTALGAMYASASVVLNDHHHDMRRDAFISNRLFDAAACGARVASDVVEGIAETFGGLVVGFNDEHDLGKLLADPAAAWPDTAERRALAARIAAEHSFDRRAQQLVEDAVRALRARD